MLHMLFARERFASRGLEAGLALVGQSGACSATSSAADGAERDVLLI